MYPENRANIANTIQMIIGSASEKEIFPLRLTLYKIISNNILEPRTKGALLIGEKAD